MSLQTWAYVIPCGFQLMFELDYIQGFLQLFSYYYKYDVYGWQYISALKIGGLYCATVCC
jgi:hypothetical protein